MVANSRQYLFWNVTELVLGVCKLYIKMDGATLAEERTDTA